MSATQFELIAEDRSEFGTNASRRLRGQGKTPAIVYGAGKDNINLLLDHNKLMHSLEVEAFHSAIIDVKTPAGTEPVIVRDVHMHPHKPLVLHVDFQRVSMTEKLHISVPIHVLGEDAAPGIKMEGGMLTRLMNEVDIQCLPRDLPEYLEVDISKLAMGDTVHLSDIKLPDGVEITSMLTDAEEHDLGIATIVATRTSSEDEDTVESDDAEAADAAAEPAADDADS